MSAEKTLDLVITQQGTGNPIGARITNEKAKAMIRAGFANAFVQVAREDDSEAEENETDAIAKEVAESLVPALKTADKSK